MKKVRFTNEQMVRILREADIAPVAAVAKKHGVSEPTSYASRKRLGTLEAMDEKRMKVVEQRSARLKGHLLGPFSGPPVGLRQPFVAPCQSAVGRNRIRERGDGVVLI